MAHLERERGEQIGEETEEHKARDRLHHVLEPARPHDHEQQQRVHDNGLQANGQTNPHASPELGDDGGETRQATGGKAVGNHEGIRRERGDRATRDDKRQVAHELRLDDAVDVDAPCHMTLTPPAR